MTEYDAIAIIKYYYPTKKIFDCGDFVEVNDKACSLGCALDEAMHALYEIKQYREIGTIEECRALASIVNKAERNDLAKIIDEWLSYSKIGTVEECREAMEKQKPKKPAPINYKNYVDKIANAEFLEDAYFCPNCKKVLRSGSYCDSCGQKLCWNENLEETEVV